VVKSVALVLGAADCLEADLARARTLIDPADCLIVACNDAGFLWPGRLDAWVTMHPEQLAGRVAERERRGHPGGFATWTRPYPFGMEERERLCDHVIGAPWTGGSSGLLTLGVALDPYRVRAALLCGMPMDERQHAVTGREWLIAPKYREGWTLALGRIHADARSFSGWTAELLGEPDAEWLAHRMSGPGSRRSAIAGIDARQPTT
jgi:hypothetical protein